MKEFLADAVWKQTVADYRQAVLTALQEAEDALAIFADEAEAQAQAQAVRAAREFERISQNHGLAGLATVMHRLVTASPRERLSKDASVTAEPRHDGTEGDSRIIEIFALRPAPVCWDALMRQPRAFQTQFRDSGGASAYFHVISRVAGRELLFGDEAPSGTS